MPASAERPQSDVSATIEPIINKIGQEDAAGLDAQPAKIDDSPTGIDFIRVTDDLLQLYTRIDKLSASLSTVSVMPVIRLVFSILKFYFALIGDFFLILPMNLVVFIRNLFPGKWSYRCFCCRYIRAAWFWFWMGEMTIPFVVFRPFAVGLLHWHFRRRLTELRRRILLETNFSEDKAKVALVKIDRALDVWQQRTTVKTILFTWVLPLVGPISALWNWLFPNDFLIFPSWTRFAVLLSISYALSFLASAFVVKRGLMLWGSGEAAYYPGFLPGQGGYGQEREILRPLDLALPEFPLDAVIILVSVLLVPLTTRAQLEMYQNWGIPLPSSESSFSYSVSNSSLSVAWSLSPTQSTILICVLWLMLIGFSLFRRKTLGRR